MADALTVMGVTGIIYVCAGCGDPVESEPCREHQPSAYAECVGSGDLPPTPFERNFAALQEFGYPESGDLS